MLTQQQKHMLTVLMDHLSANDVPPSFEELCAAMNLKSKSGIHRLLSGLEERGYIRRLPNRARAIEVIKYPDGSLKLDMIQGRGQREGNAQPERRCTRARRRGR